VRFKWTNTLPRENALFLGSLGQGFNWDGLQRFIAGYQPPTKHCARQGDLRAFAKKAGYKIVGSGSKSPPGQSRSAPNARRSWRLAQARKVDVILVTELTSWGRSVLNVL
jgi:hypothetical protein